MMIEYIISEMEVKFRYLLYNNAEITPVQVDTTQFYDFSKKYFPSKEIPNNINYYFEVMLDRIEKEFKLIHDY